MCGIFIFRNPDRLSEKVLGLPNEDLKEKKYNVKNREICREIEIGKLF